MSLLLLLQSAGAPASSITVTGIGSATGTGTVSVTVPSGTDKLVVTASGARSVANPAVTGVTFNGTALTLAKAQTANTTIYCAAEIWYLDDPAPSGDVTANVVVTWATTPSQIITVMTVDGAADGAPSATAGTADTDGGTGTATSVTVTDDSVSIEAWTNYENKAGAPNSGQNELYDDRDPAGVNPRGGSAYEVHATAGTPSQDYTWATGPSVVAYAVAVWGVPGPGTFTGTAAPVAGGAHSAGTATHTTPTYSGTGTPITGGTFADGTATFTAPSYIGTGAPVVGGAHAAGTATHTPPTYSATGTGTTGGAYSGGTATFDLGTFTGTGSPTVGGTHAAGTGTVTNPTYSATGTCTVGGASASGTASFQTLAGGDSRLVRVGGTRLTPGGGTRLRPKP